MMENTVEFRTEFVKKLGEYERVSAEIGEMQKVIDDSGWQHTFDKEISIVANESVKYGKDNAKRKVLRIFQVVFGRAAVTEKQMLCTLHSRGYEYQIVAAKYGIGLQRNKQARQIKDWTELQLLLDNKDVVLSALKSSSKQGIVKMAEKFELFTSIVDPKKMEEVPYNVYAEVPLVKPVKKLNTRLGVEHFSDESYKTMCVWQSYAGARLGVRVATYCTPEQVSRREANGWNDAGVHDLANAGLMGVRVLAEIEKDWPYYKLKLIEQLNERVRAGKQMILLLEEAFAADMLVAEL